jgi:hypothetical protein
MTRALPWALATMIVAVADVADLIPGEVATTLITVLPLMMVVTLSGKSCAQRSKAA